MMPHTRTLPGGLLLGLLLAGGSPVARADNNEQVQSANRTATAATRATADMANFCAQGAARGMPCTPTLTSTPPPTSTPRPVDTPFPIQTPTLVATEIPPPEPCWLTDLRTGDPDNGNVVFVPNDDGTEYVPVQIPCDATPTPEPTDTPVAPTGAVPPSPTVRPIARPAPPIAPARQVAPAAAPTPRVVYVYAPADTPTPADTLTPSPSPTPTPTMTPTAEPTATMTPRPTFVPELIVPTPRPTAEGTGALGRTVSWTMLLGMLGGAVCLVAGGYGIYRYKRRHYLAQLAALESKTA